MKHITLIFGTIFLLTIMSCTGLCHKKSCCEESAEPSAGTVLPIDPNVKIGTLSNGLRYYIRENHKPENRAVLRLAVNAGSILEDEDQKGLAHFVEHMAFNGSTHFNKSELVDYLEGIGMRFGADLNAHTSFDETVYKLQVPMDDPEVIKKAFQILEDWAHGVAFEEEEIDKERGVIKEEWRLGQGAGMRMWNKHAPILFNNSMYSKRLPIGDIAIVDTAHYETLRRFYKDWYRPDLMAVVAVGDFDSAVIEEYIKNYFEKIPEVKKPRERKIFSVPDHEKTFVSIASDPEATRTKVTVYFKKPVRNEQTKENYRHNILENLYSGMINARFDEITKKPDAPFMYAYSFTNNIALSKSAHVLLAGVKEDGITDGLKTILMEAERVALFGFTQTELDRQKTEFMRRIERAYNERDKTESKRYVNEYVRNYLEGESIPGIEHELELYKNILPNIQLLDINQMSAEMLPGGNRVVTVSAPEKESLILPGDEELLSLFAEVKTMDITPYIDAVSDEPLVKTIPTPSKIESAELLRDIDVEKIILSNGVTILLKPTKFKNDEILFTSFSPGGKSKIADEGYASADAAADLIENFGIGGFTQIELEKKLAGKVVSVSPYIDGLFEGISGSASPKDIETMFQLIYLYFTAPRMDENAFEATLSRWRGFLENRSSRPESAYRDTIQVTMAQYHHRERPWTLDFLDEIDLETAYTFYKDRFKDAGDFTFFFVGNFEPDAIKPFLQTWLGGLPTNLRKETWVDNNINPPVGRINKSVIKGMDPKSMTQIIFTGPFEWSRENRYELNSMAHAFRIKLREVLREDMGGVYGVGVRASTDHYPDEDYRLTVTFGCAPERVDELTEAVFEQIDSLMAAGTTEKYLNKVKETQRRERETSLKENKFWLRQLSSSSIHNQDLSNILQFETLVNTLTLDIIQQAANQYFGTENIVQVTLYPEKSSE